MLSIGIRRLITIAGPFALISLLFYVINHNPDHLNSLHHSSSNHPLQSTYIKLDPLNPIETTYVKGVAGFSYFNNLYLSNGTFIAITSQPTTFPTPEWIMTAEEQPGDLFKNTPAGRDRWDVVGVEEMEGRVGRVGIRKGGHSMFFNDEKGKNIPSMLNHYYHFVAEAFMGGWIAIVSADPSVITKQQLPSRMMFRTPADDWRDRAALTTWLQQAIMPETEIEENSIWKDRKVSGLTFLFEKIVIIDRFSAHNKGRNTFRFNKMTGDLHDLPAPATWMKPLRDNLKRFLIPQGCDFQRKNPRVPVVTYIDRQSTTRKLVEEDHQALMTEMQSLHDQGKIEFYDAIMEDIPRHDQFCMAARTDIMLGVHGNGLSHQLWMKPGGTVIEIMDMGGFAADYFTPARLMSHDYYIIHNDTIFPKTKWVGENGMGVSTTAGFHGSNIRVHGKFVAELVASVAKERRLPTEDVLKM